MKDLDIFWKEYLNRHINSIAEVIVPVEKIEHLVRYARAETLNEVREFLLDRLDTITPHDFDPDDKENPEKIMYNKRQMLHLIRLIKEGL